jgi:hypothetical protein
LLVLDQLGALIGIGFLGFLVVFSYQMVQFFRELKDSTIETLDVNSVGSIFIIAQNVAGLFPLAMNYLPSPDVILEELQVAPVLINVGSFLLNLLVIALFGGMLLLNQFGGNYRHLFFRCLDGKATPAVIRWWNPHQRRAFSWYLIQQLPTSPMDAKIAIFRWLGVVDETLRVFESGPIPDNEIAYLATQAEVFPSYDAHLERNLGYAEERSQKPQPNRVVAGIQKVLQVPLIGEATRQRYDRLRHSAQSPRGSSVAQYHNELVSHIQRLLPPESAAEVSTDLTTWLSLVEALNAQSRPTNTIKLAKYLESIEALTQSPLNATAAHEATAQVQELLGLRAREANETWEKIAVLQGSFAKILMRPGLVRVLKPDLFPGNHHLALLPGLAEGDLDSYIRSGLKFFVLYELRQGRNVRPTVRGLESVAFAALWAPRASIKGAEVAQILTKIVSIYNLNKYVALRVLVLRIWRRLQSVLSQNDSVTILNQIVTGALFDQLSPQELNCTFAAFESLVGEDPEILQKLYTSLAAAREVVLEDSVQERLSDFLRPVAR